MNQSSLVARGVSPPMSVFTPNTNTGDAPSFSYQEVQDRLNHRMMQVIDELNTIVVQQSFLLSDLEEKMIQQEHLCRNQIVSMNILLARLARLEQGL